MNLYRAFQPCLYILGVMRINYIAEQMGIIINLRSPTAIDTSALLPNLTIFHPLPPLLYKFRIFLFLPHFKALPVFFPLLTMFPSCRFSEHLSVLFLRHLNFSPWEHIIQSSYLLHNFMSLKSRFHYFWSLLFLSPRQRTPNANLLNA